MYRFGFETVMYEYTGLVLRRLCTCTCLVWIRLCINVQTWFGDDYV